MTIFYQIFIKLYPFFVKVASLRNLKARKWVEGRKKSFDTISQFVAGNKKPIIWMHCASLGEFEQGLPVAEKLKETYPSHAIVISFFSSSGYAIRANHPVSDCSFYLPMDSEAHAKKLLDLLQPSLVVFVKYEFWYHYLKNIHQRKIPCLLVSAIFRKSQPFFTFYGGFYRKMLAYFNAILVQDEGSAALLHNIGCVDQVIVSGDTRFDRVIAIADGAKKIEVVEDFLGAEKAVVCGSTWPGDDAILGSISNDVSFPKFIVAPHNISEERIANCLAIYPRSQTYSSWHLLTQEQKDTCRVLIIDNIGMLSSLYRYACIAFIGGGFDATGIHNTLEAAVYGIPVVFGPKYQKYLEAVELIEAGGAVSVNNREELENFFESSIANGQWSMVNGQSGKIAKAYVEGKAGATNKILAYIQAKRLLTN